MSEMEVYYGKYSRSDAIILEDEDLYDAEERLDKQFLRVDGTLYEFEPIEEVDNYGFSLKIEPFSEGNRFICYWHNGGAGIHEVLEELIRREQT